jgi:hypothetical protein
VPVISPAAMAQVPEQQSPSAVHGPPLQVHAGAHAPLVAPGSSGQTSPKQQSALVVHAWPISPQARGTGQVPLSHQREQHSDQAEQLVPAGKQPKHRSVPSPSGRHLASPQHCSSNWQTYPGEMHMTGSQG